MQQHGGLLKPLVEAAKICQSGRRALPAAFKASYRKENRGMLLKSWFMCRFFEQGRVAMDEIYGDDSLSKEEKKRRASCLPYWQQRAPGAFSVLPVRKERRYAMIEYTPSAVERMIKGKHLSMNVDTTNGFWPFDMLKLCGAEFVQYGKFERCLQAVDRTRAPRVVPSLCYTRDQFDRALRERAGRMPWILTGFFTDTYSLVLRLERWTARDRSEGLRKDVYVPLAGSRAEETALLPRFTFHSSADLPSRGLFKDAKFEGV